MFPDQSLPSLYRDGRILRIWVWAFAFSLDLP
ncbi:MAG: hypothetical protein BWY56_00652 [Acidobacteria bacterium ADurb.Bin340]|jgi:hypothetical protein|nr:MAG: hypothetical protein BWY56_00652 [Acidobacteria bacterium ADurb.Bin340]